MPVITPNLEELVKLNDMHKIIIGYIPQVGKTDGLRTVVHDDIHHLAECSIPIPLPAGLDNKVNEPPVQDGIEGIDLYLIEAPLKHVVAKFLM